ncbi:MAG: helical backbone metal receptor [Phycisphaerae bacterium]|jgi:ABC-type Fe3+-hydroxamate transport system substrate-binding protein
MEHVCTDHLGRRVVVPQPPRRIVSLCPSLTETLFALGLAGRVVGRTEFCIHPAEQVRDVPTVGGPKTVDVAGVLALEPDLVIAAKEENRPEHVAALADVRPVYVVDVDDIEQSLRAIRDLGTLTGCVPAAESLIEAIRARFASLPRLSGPRVAYLIWRDPLMTVGRDTYIHSLLERCGLDNVAAALPGRYPAVTLAQLQARRPGHVWLSSEPFPFAQEHADELARHLPESSVRLVDGEMFGWYGSRMLAASDYLRRLLTELAAPPPEDAQGR